MKFFIGMILFFMILLGLNYFAPNKMREISSKLNHFFGKDVQYESFAGVVTRLKVRPFTSIINTRNGDCTVQVKLSDGTKQTISTRDPGCLDIFEGDTVKATRWKFAHQSSFHDWELTTQPTL